MSTTRVPSRRQPLRTSLIVTLFVGLIGGIWYWSDHRLPSATSAAGHSGMPSPSGGPGGGPGKSFGGGLAQPVSVAEAQTKDIHVWLNALGTVTPRNLVTVHTKVDGTLLKVNFREGQMVSEGDVLAEIDPRPFQIQLDQAKGQLTRDTALLDNAQLDLKRYKGLLLKDATPRQQVETQDALVRQYEGTVAADRAQVANAQLQLDWTHVAAPSSGRIGLRQVDPGNQVHAGDTDGIASIAQMQPTTVVFAVPESNLAAINRRLNAHETIPVEAWDREQKSRLAEGHLLTTDNQIDPSTGTIKIKAEFANGDSALFPNQFVNIRLLLDTLPQVVAVPSVALLRGDQGSFVYRVNAENKVAMVALKPGAVDGDWVAVTGDIKPGDKLVTDGTDKLRDGALIETIKPTTQDEQPKQKHQGGEPPQGAQKHRRESAP